MTGVAPAESQIVGVHEPTLPHGCGGLFVGYARGVPVVSDDRASRRHRARRDEHDVQPPVVEGGDLVGQVLHHVHIQAVVRGEYGAAHLDHHAARPLDGAGPFLAAVHSVVLSWSSLVSSAKRLHMASRSASTPSPCRAEMKNISSPWFLAHSRKRCTSSGGIKSILFTT